jgi:predicted ATPase
MNIAAAKEKSSGGGASRVSLVSNSNTVQKFVLTGGPCGGKTTALERIRVFLSQYGIRVYTVPEAATILWTGGISPSDMKNGDDWVDFQATLMRTQFHLEDTLYTMAEKTGQKSVLLCDRGAMDGKAYVDDSTWAKILAQNNVLEMDICDSRYNAVLHLVTAAHSAEKFFSSETNVTRRETAEEARALDQNILRGWMPHPKQYVFGNKDTGFEAKMAKLMSRVCELCGLPSTNRKARKFLLSDCTVPADIKSVCFKIEKIYPFQLAEKGGAGYTFVRKRTKINGADAIHSYGFTRVRIDESTGQKVEVKRILTGREYAQISENPDPKRYTVLQERTSFLLNESTCYICKYLAPSKVAGLQILYVQSSSTEDSTRTDNNFPTWLNVQREITGDSNFSSYTMSIKEEEEEEEER